MRLGFQLSLYVDGEREHRDLRVEKDLPNLSDTREVPTILRKRSGIPILRVKSGLYSKPRKMYINIKYTEILILSADG